MTIKEVYGRYKKFDELLCDKEKLCDTFSFFSGNYSLSVMASNKEGV